MRAPAGLAVFGKTRRLTNARGEVLVAQTAAAAFRNHETSAGLRQIGKQPFGSLAESPVDQRSDRNGDRQIGSASPGFVRGSARLAGFGREAAPEPELDEGREFRRRFEVDAAPVAAVAAGRAAFRHVFLATPGYDTVAAVPSGHFDLGLVDKLHGTYLRRKKKRGLTAPMNGGRTALTGRQHRDVLAVAAGAKADNPVSQGKERVIAAQADVRARIELRSTLAHQDVSSDYPLSAKPLDAEALSVGITSVPGRAGALFRGKKLKI